MTFGSIRSGILFTATLLSCLSADVFTKARALQWQPIGPEGGRIDGLAPAATNPNRMYVLPFRQGVWRSENRGTNWARVDAGLGESIYEAIAVSATDQNVLIIAPQIGNSILRSMDGGVTWTPALVANGIGTILHIAFDPLNSQNVLLSTMEGSVPGVYRSTDGGASWMYSSNGLGFGTPGQIAYHPTIEGLVLLAAETGVFRSTDGGASWIASNTNGNGTVGSISICRTNPSQVWSVGYPDGFLRSTDGGLSFQGTGIPSGCGEFGCLLHAVLVHPLDSAQILGGFYNMQCTATCNLFVYVRRSTNGGSTWSQSFAPNGDWRENQKISSFFFDAQSSGDAYFSIGGVSEENVYGTGLVRTTDAGATWAPWMNGLTGLNILKVDADVTGRVFARGSQLQGLWSSSSPGSAWTDDSANMPGYFQPSVFEVNPTIAGILYEAGYTFSIDGQDPGFIWSLDSGVTWTGASFPTNSLWTEPKLIAADHLDGHTVYVWSDSEVPYLCRGTSVGSFLDFNIVHEGFLAAGAVVNPGDADRVFAIRRDAPGDVQLTTDGGITWISRSIGLPSGQAVTLLGDAASPGGQGLVAVYRTAGVFKTLNGGVSWSPVALPGYASQPIIDADLDPATDRLFLATQSAGVYVSGAGFVGTGLPTAVLASIRYDQTSQSVLLATNHASVLRLDVGSAVDATVIDEMPTKLAISARPNPSTGVLRFELNLPNATSHAEVIIFDVSGRRIATPFSGALSTGKHGVEWRGRMESGKRPAPGVYFARLEAEGKVATTRITVVE